LFLSVVGLLAAQGGKTLDGKQIFTDQKCQMCHDVSTAGIQATTKSEKMKGPDLATVVSGKDAKVLANVLRKKANTAHDKPHPKAFTGTDEELGALIAWLQAQKSATGQKSGTNKKAE